jgi:hypothetical protein
MSFDFPAVLIYPVVLSVLFPFGLLLIARFAPVRGKNATQFFYAALLQVALWAAGSLVLPEALRNRDALDWLLGAMVVASGLLLWLEAWALLSRGYTLSMLLILLRAAQPLSKAELARRYRGGTGLEWIMQHRVGGLTAAGLVRTNGADLELTPHLGLPVAVLYRITIAIFGLRKTG